jgi:glycosyltransferase involved in cell wall biosynthesis
MPPVVTQASPSIRVLELRSVWGTGGGPDKTILASAHRANGAISQTVCYLCDANDPIFTIGEQALKLGIDYVEIRERHSLDPAIWPALRRIVRARQIDIVHAHEYKTDLLAYLLGKAEPIIPFATAHGWTGHSRRERFVYYPADKRLLARFPRVAAVSEEIRRELAEVGGRERRTDVVLNGIDPVRFRRDRSKREFARKAYRLGADHVVIGAVGRLEPQKRFDLLIDAFQMLAKEDSRLRLLIAGEGSLRRNLEQQVTQLELSRACRLVGQAEVIQFHHTLDLFVQSSDYEGTSNAVLEAMALETPIVATNVGGTAELVTDNVHGLLVRPGAARCLGDTLKRALADPAAAGARAAAARLRVENDFSFEQRMRKMEAIYEELVAERRRTARIEPRYRKLV